MSEFFKQIDPKSWRKVSPNVYIWFVYLPDERSWLATLHDENGNQIGDSILEVNKYDAIIQCIKLNNGY